MTLKTKLFSSVFLVLVGVSFFVTKSNNEHAPTAPTEEPVFLHIDQAVDSSLSFSHIRAIEETLSIINAKAELETIIHQVKPGESLSTIFSQLDFDATDLNKIVHGNSAGQQFASINPGNKLTFKVDKNRQIQQLSYDKNPIETLVAKKQDNSYEVEKISKEIQHKTASARVNINSSLFLDGKSAGLSDKIIMELANIFAWDIDFALNLRPGDHFTVVYEKLFVEGEALEDGDIVSAEFVNKGKTFTAVKYQNPDGRSNYYTPEGRSLKKAFIRTPVDFARISSPFNLKRKHPVLNKIRAHKGVDYAAKTGTPVKSTSDGKITFRGYQRGYGRVVIVQHGKKYSTLYAHLSRFRTGQKTGSRVNQGEVIGYVGQSGLATGPHLHYEFRVNGVHRNPLTVKLPNDKPLDKNLLADFKQQTAPFLAELSKVKASSLLANNQQQQ